MFLKLKQFVLVGLATVAPNSTAISKERFDICTVEKQSIFGPYISELLLKLQFFGVVFGAVGQFVRFRWDDYQHTLLRHVLTQPQ